MSTTRQSLCDPEVGDEIVNPGSCHGGSRKKRNLKGNLTKTSSSLNNYGPKQAANRKMINTNGITKSVSIRFLTGDSTPLTVDMEFEVPTGQDSSSDTGDGSGSSGGGASTPLLSSDSLVSAVANADSFATKINTQMTEVASTNTALASMVSAVGPVSTDSLVVAEP
jgi:hypothetical protein